MTGLDRSSAIERRPHDVVSRHTRNALVLAFVSGAAFALVLVIVRPVVRPSTFDLQIAQWMAAHRTGSMITAARVASWLGSVFGIVPLALSIAWYVRRRHGWASVRWYALAVVGATIFYLALNYSIERSRPPMGLRLLEDTEWSFPSGHSTQAVVFWFMSAILVTMGRPPRVRLAGVGLALLCTLAIGGSRICLCAHWTTDVLGGFALGTCWLACMLALRARAAAPSLAGADDEG